MKKTKVENEVITIEISKNDLFALYLSLMCKSGVLAIKLSSATSQEEANRADQELGLTNRLIGEVQEALK